MSYRTFTGFRLSWRACLQLPIWAARSWPVSVPTVLGLGHYLLATRFVISEPALHIVNMTLVAGLPVLGAGMILYAIDSNLRIFERSSLLGRFIGYLQQFPFCSWSVTLTPVSATHKVTGGPCRVRSVGHDGSIEGRVEALERQLKELDNELATRIQDVREELRTCTQNLEAKLNKNVAETRRLANDVKRMTSDGVGTQIMGFLFIAHGSIANVLLSM